MNKKLMQVLIIVMGVLLSGSVGFNVSGACLRDSDTLTIQEGLGEVLSPVMAKVVQAELGGLRIEMNERFDALELQTYDSDIEELYLALKDVRTPEEVDALVNYWIENSWTKKLSAIHRISEFDKAREKLKDKLFSDEVFRTLMLYSI